MNIIIHDHWRPTELNSVGACTDTTSGRGRKRYTFICIIVGRGRKTVGASAPIKMGALFHDNMLKIEKIPIF